MMCKNIWPRLNSCSTCSKNVYQMSFFWAKTAANGTECRSKQLGMGRQAGRKEWWTGRGPNTIHSQPLEPWIILNFPDNSCVNSRNFEEYQSGIWSRAAGVAPEWDILHACREALRFCPSVLASYTVDRTRTVFSRLLSKVTLKKKNKTVPTCKLPVT